jgi:uncharacterized LabA/DUF88 family protein
MAPTVSFLIDGLNVYHSIKDALAHGKIQHGKWIDYATLCRSFVPLFGRQATLGRVHYFSALATHIPDPGLVARHQRLIKVLEATGVHVVLGNFKSKTVLCQAQCKQSFTTHEEKETDVNIALGLVSAFMSGECDVAVIMSGDTDLVAAVVTAKSLFPSAQVAIAFPYGRKNRHFDRIADRTFKVSSNLYEKYQIPDPFVLPDGTALSKPAKW